MDAATIKLKFKTDTSSGFLDESHTKCACCSWVSTGTANGDVDNMFGGKFENCRPWRLACPLRFLLVVVERHGGLLDVLASVAGAWSWAAYWLAGWLVDCLVGGEGPHGSCMGSNRSSSDCDGGRGSGWPGNFGVLSPRQLRVCGVYML